MSSKHRLHQWMIRLVSLAVPRRQRAEWRREWEAELTAVERAGRNAPEALTGRSLVGHSLGAWPDALAIQRRRLEDELVRDVKYAVRALLHAPIFCLTAILLLAVGIGAATAVFAVANATLLQPLPYPEADRLVLIETDRGRYFSMPVFNRIDGADEALELVAASEGRELVLSTREFPELIRGHRITADMPALLGLHTSAALRPVRGRPFAPHDFEETSDAVAVLSHRSWVNRFHSSDEVVGQIVVLDSIPTRIIGVLPPSVGLFGESELLLPWRSDGAAAYDESQRTLEVFGRLAAGVDVPAAQGQLNRLFQSLRPAERAHLELLRDRTTHAYRSTLAALWLVTMGVLLVCCLSFASLLATRTSGKREELAVRVALGATRAQLIRQLLTEAVLLSIAAGVFGVLLARLGRDALVTTITAPGTRILDVPFDWVVVTFAAVLSAAIGIWFSLSSARRATAAGDIVGTLRRGPSSGDAPGRRAAGWFTGAVQVAVTMALLASVGVLVQSVLRVQTFDSGYALEDVVMVRYDLPLARYGTGSQIADFANQLIDGVRRAPGGPRAAASTSMPVGSMAVQLRPFATEVEPPYPLGPPEPLPPGWPAPPPPPPASGAPGASRRSVHQALSADVSPGYFSTLGVPVLAGREFAPYDLASSEPVVVVNEAMASRYWAGQNPIGQRIRIGIRPPWLTVVGVVGDVKRFAQDDRPRSEFYRPLAQIPQGVTGLGAWRERTRPVYIAVRTEMPLAQVAATLGPIVFALDDGLPARRIARLEDELDAGMQQRRAVLRLFLVLAVIALLVAVSGVYGVTAYVVRQQQPTLGIRSALGASGGQLIWLVMRANLSFLAAGMLAGVILAGVITPQVQRLVPDVTRGDWGIVGAIGVILSAVLTLATYLAARKGGRVDPLQVLRSG